MYSVKLLFVYHTNRVTVTCVSQIFAVSKKEKKYQYIFGILQYSIVFSKAKPSVHIVLTLDSFSGRDQQMHKTSLVNCISIQRIKPRPVTEISPYNIILFMKKKITLPAAVLVAH